MNGAGLVSLCAPESWGRLSGEPTAACSCSCCIIHDNKLAKEIFLTALPAATSWRSRPELVVQDTLVAKPSHEIHTHNSMEAGGKADGRATVAPHEQTQSISHFNSPSRGRLLLGNPASLLHRCSAVLLLPCGPSFAPALGRAMLTRAPSSLQAEISSPHQCLEAGGSQEDENVEDTVHCPRHGELCSS